MQEAIRKSEVLIEALPYIKSFHEKVIVIKYGGSTIVDKKKRHNVLKDIIFMNYAGMHPVLVHGGGPYITEKLKKRGIRSRFVHGLRITDEDSLHIIKEVMARINRVIVKEIRALGGRAQGLTRRSNIIRVRKNARFGDIGYVGEITSINTAKIEDVFKSGAIPVISPLGVGRDHHAYNVNADQASTAIAISLAAEKLAFLTNVEGILKDKDDKDSLISTLSVRQVSNMMRRKKIDGGMIPKAKACIAALHKGVNKVHVINGSLTHALLLEIFTDKGIGTQIVKAKKEVCYVNR